MKLKKFIAAFALLAAVTCGAFAKNHPYGMDIVAGVIGVEYCSATYREWGNPFKIEASHNVVDLFPIKVNAYICPWLNNHLGIYGEVGVLPGVNCNYKEKVMGFEAKSNAAGFNIGLETMIGPAFGIDLGESSVRFQVGAPFHYMVGWGALATDPNFNAAKNAWDWGRDIDLTYSAFGLALTPQFRFAANKRCSFVVGMDFVFDFVYNETWEYNAIVRVNGRDFTYKQRYSPTSDADSTFRFAWLPYLGVGINFGN